jgi:sporulation protein YlmC with PRC-barrel domain
VVDPVARRVTHLVVEPKHRQGLGRLVPLDLVDATSEQLLLRCTLAEFEQLDDAEETDFMLDMGGNEGYAAGQVLSLPYYSLGGDVGIGMGNTAQPIVYDKVPLGEVAIRRNEHVHATDGDIGRVQGLVIDSSDQHVTHVLLQEGHFWGRKQVAIPIGAVIGVDDGIRLNITKQQVQDLPPVDVDHPGD